MNRQVQRAAVMVGQPLDSGFGQQTGTERPHGAIHPLVVLYGLVTAGRLETSRKKGTAHCRATCPRTDDEASA